MDKEQRCHITQHNQFFGHLVTWQVTKPQMAQIVSVQLSFYDEEVGTSYKSCH